MRKRLAILICSALLLAATGCHFHRHGLGHPRGMPPGQAKKIDNHGITKLPAKGPKHKHHAKPWK